MQTVAALNRLLATGNYNRNDLMSAEFDLSDFMDDDGNVNLDQIKEIYPTMELMPPEQSIYHQQGIDSDGNMKFADDYGNELVFGLDGSLVVNSVNVGTYNFSPASVSAVDHLLFDMIPYWFKGTSPDDPTTFMERIIPSWMGGGYPDTFDPNWTQEQRDEYQQMTFFQVWAGDRDIQTAQEFNEYLERYRIE